MTKQPTATETSRGLCSPYRFVEAATEVFLPEWAAQVSHDKPFEDGLSGYLDLNIEALTPLFTRDDGADPSVFLNLDGQYFIKGTSVRGMLRNVMAIASMGKLSQVDDRRFGVRDIAKSQTPYLQMIRKDNTDAVCAGWLERSVDDEGQRHYKLYPCQMARVSYEQLTKLQTGWKANERFASDKYKTWKLSRDYKASISQGRYYMSAQLNAGSTPGTLVFTGDTGAQRNAKKADYFFYDEKAVPLEVSEEVFEQFEQAHSASQQRSDLGVDGQEPNEIWGYWRPELFAGKRVPVFYLSNEGGNNVTHIGLAKMFRVPSDIGVHDAIKNIAPAHFDRRPDLPALIFGYIPGEDRLDSGELALKGRVSFSSAKLVEGAEVLSARSVVLSSPKPSFALAYLKQSLKAPHYNMWLPDARIRAQQRQAAGWKRYPARAEVSEPQKKIDNDRQYTTFKPLDKGARFEQRVWFHNLKPCELGALLWCVDFGGLIEKPVHRLGMAKPYGFGEVRLSYKLGEVIANDPERDVPSADECVQAFYEQLLKVDVRWLESDTIKQLLLMADAATFALDKAELAYYSTPRAYQEQKTQLRVFGPLPFASRLDEPLRVASAHVQSQLLARRAAAEEARLAKLSPLERAQEWCQDMRDGEAMEFVREKLQGKEVSALSAELLNKRRALELRFYASWSQGSLLVVDEGNVSAKRLKEYASALADAVSAQAKSTEETPAHKAPPTDRAELLAVFKDPSKGSIRTAADAAVLQGGWSCDELDWLNVQLRAFLDHNSLKKMFKKKELQDNWVTRFQAMFEACCGD